MSIEMWVCVTFGIDFLQVYWVDELLLCREWKHSKWRRWRTSFPGFFGPPVQGHHVPAPKSQLLWSSCPVAYFNAFGLWVLALYSSGFRYDFRFTRKVFNLSNLELLSRIYAQTLISNQPSWLNSSSATCSHVLEVSSLISAHQSSKPNRYRFWALFVFLFLKESVGTRVLIPLPGGLIELFVNKQVRNSVSLSTVISYSVS